MDFHIIDNFLIEEQFKKIKQACFSKNCEDNVNWFRHRVVDKKDENYYFTGALIVMLVVLAFCGGPGVQ